MATNQAVFTVQLKDLISGPAAAAARSLAGITKAVASVNKATGAVRGPLRDARGRFAARGGSAASLAGGAGGGGGGGGRFLSLLRDKKAFDHTSSAIGSIGSRAAQAALWVGALAKGIATFGAITFTKQVVDMAAYAEASKLAFKNLTHSEEGWERSKRLALEFGMGIQDTTDQMKKLVAAQFKVGEAEELIKLTTDLRSIGSTAQQTANAIMAITQIKAKGRLQSEELVGQLAEAGVATTLVYTALAKNMHKSEQQVKDLLKAGKIDAATGIRAIQDAIMAKANIKHAGDAGKSFANATLTGMLERLKNAPERLFLRVAEAAEGLVPKVKGLVEQIEAAVNNTFSTRELAQWVTGMVDLASKALPLAVEMVRGFASGIGSIIDAVGGTKDVEVAKERFWQFGKALAELVRLGVVALDFFVRFANWATSGPGKIIVGVVLLAAGLFKLVSAVGAAAGLFGGAAGSGMLASMGAFGVGIAAIISPIGIVIATLTAAAAAIWYFWDDIKKIVDEVSHAMGVVGKLLFGSDGTINVGTSAPTAVSRPQLSPGELFTGGAAPIAGDSYVNIRQIMVQGASTEKPEDFARRISAELRRSMSGAKEANTGA